MTSRPKSPDPKHRTKSQAEDSAIDRSPPVVQNMVDDVERRRRPRLRLHVKHLHLPVSGPDAWWDSPRTVDGQGQGTRLPLGAGGYMQKRLDTCGTIMPRRPRPSSWDGSLTASTFGYGAFWGGGEVETCTQGARCLRLVTPRPIRDTPDDRTGFQRLAGIESAVARLCHVVDYCIDFHSARMAVKDRTAPLPNRHGAIVVPTDQIGSHEDASEGLTAREARIIGRAKPAATRRPQGGDYG